MAINLNLYTFSKRENSTKQPTGSPTSFSCTMIDDTSLMNPTFKLSIASNPIGYNYAYVSAFDRYYFIKDIRTYQNFWYISCECDVLASFKTEIGSGSHYVLRSASNYDGAISDTLYPASTTVSSYIDYADSPGDPMKWSNGHCYILGIAGYTDEVIKQYGSLIYYILDDFTLRKFLEYLMDNVDSWSSLTGEYSSGVIKALINPIQYIKSCICMPFTVDSITGTTTAAIKFGYYSWPVVAGGTCKCVTDYNVVKSKEYAYIDIRQHPQAATRGSFLNCQPFSKYTLHYGPWGDIDLDPLLLQGNNKIRIETLYDLVSGVCRLLVTGNVVTAKVLYNSSIKVGIDINLSQIYKDALGYEAATTNGIFSAVTAGLSLGNGNISAIGSGLNIASSGVQDMTRLNYPTVTGVGDTGTFLSVHDPENLYVTSRFNHIVDENLAEIGRPLCQTKVINTLSGFILCQLADCQITGTQEEAQKINNYMNTGFFYE